MAQVVKQPSEIRDLSFNLTNLISDGATLLSATGFASRKVTLNTTTAAAVSAEAGTVQLTANPGIGALLILNPAGPTEEQVKVSDISGSVSPFTATIVPTCEFAHSNGEAVNYEPGASSRLLVSTAATVISGVAKFRLRRGAAGQTYRISCLGVCDNDEEVEDECDCVVSEI